MKLLIDMSLSPSWAEYLAASGVEARHWSEVGDPKAPDRLIMKYARQHGYVVFTHDLDFGNILAVTHAVGPSVIQVRTEDPVPAAIGQMVVAALVEHEAHLRRGSLITIEPERSRARVLPIVPGTN